MTFIVDLWTACRICGFAYVTTQFVECTPEERTFSIVRQQPIRVTAVYWRALILPQLNATDRVCTEQMTIRTGRLAGLAAKAGA